MEVYGHTMSFGGMVGDKKMQAEAFWPGPSIDVSFSGIAETFKLNVEVNETIN